MTWEAAFTAQSSELAAAPAARQPATLGEIWRNEWDAAGLGTSFGVGRPLTDAYGQLVDRLTSALDGEPLGVAAAKRGKDLVGGFDRTIDVLKDIASGLPDQKFRQVEPFLDVRRKAAQAAAASEAKAADSREWAYGLSGHAVAFAANVARQAVDPVNLATLPLGAARGASILRMLSTEFAVGAATQAVQEPYIQTMRGELGLSSGIEDGLVNVLEAGIGAAALSGLLRGGAAIYRHLRDTGRAAPLEASGLSPDDLDAAAAHAARDELFQSLAVSPDHAGRRVDGDHIDSAAAALESGRVLTDALEVPRVMIEEAPATADVAGAPAAPPLDRIAQNRAALADLDTRITVLEAEAATPLGAGDASLRFELDSLHALRGDRQSILDGLERQGRDVPPVSREPIDSAGGDRAAGAESIVPVTEPDRVASIAARRNDPTRRQTNRPRRPLSLTQFIAKNGGLALDGDARGGDFQKLFIPGGGPLARKSGLSIDGYWREALIEAGYLPADADGGMARDITRELFDLIEKERAGQKTYAARDRDAVAELDAARLDTWSQEVEASAQTIRREAEALGLGEIDSGTLYDAAELLARGDEPDWDHALERAYLTRELDAPTGPDTAAVVYKDDLPGWENDHAVQRRTTSEDGGPPDREGRGRDAPGSQAKALRASGDSAGLGETRRPESGQSQRDPGGQDPSSLGPTRLPNDPVILERAARRADAERALEAVGGDYEVLLDDGRRASARDLLDDLNIEDAAADNVLDCILRGPAP
ncbi:hypothetical protein [Chelatococcus asaccharovorans]|uniref:Uncharacterized protein n=1 Tax=Chelatococcus asaccharovorans TaxID=28210 RepID=A0A2V3UBD8_9HYPH|nr:hypothetical protein [Chelatococcus asaccharovorans]MBS7703172.1 hypothetical protein [Chelatococcus asaccharovorans]PXW61501.1 hypothetical protein C7450_10316 [Chelatococcus asaccharovorans]